MASLETVNRKNLFDKCNKKITDFERLLTNGHAETISLIEGGDLNLDYFERRRSGLINKLQSENRDLAIINFQSSNKTAAHSLILVINENIPAGWSIFDSNGTKYFPFKIIDNGKNVTKKYTDVNINKSLNFGSDTANPGYCATFGIIFIVYYLKNYHNKEWISEWKKLLNIISTKIDDVKGSFAVDIAFEIQKYINNAKLLNKNKIVDDIYDIIISSINFNNTSGGFKTKTNKKKSKKNSKNNNKTKRKYEKR